MSSQVRGSREETARPELGGHRPGGSSPTTARPVLGREAFARLVHVERRRSERSGRSFGILVLRAPISLDPASAMGRAVRDAVVGATRETDVTGWIAPPTALGVLLPDLPTSRPWAAVERVCARIQRALGPHQAAGNGVTVAGRLFPEAAPPDVVRELDASPPGVATALLERLVYPERGEAGSAHRRGEALKRCLDVVGSVALLVALAPLLLLIAGLVRRGSPGPILFRQARVGYRGRPFTMLKFRTMYVGTDDAAHREFVSRFIESGDRALPVNGAGAFKLTADPRVTPIGHFLRKTSFDELPQLWNVLRGEMSLVGPRPPLAYELAQYAPWHRRRVLEARPGVTGLWQVRGRSRTTFDDMVRLDLRYARTRSLATDLRILLATPRAVISGKGAH